MEKNNKKEIHTFTFVDLFAGIGGFHTAMHSVGAHCVFASEWDKYARISSVSYTHLTLPTIRHV